jgi:hypothetical protein
MRKILLCLVFFGQAAYASSITTTFAIHGITFLFNELSSNEIVVTASGTGKTQEEAVNNALVSSVQKGIGVFIVSDLTVQDERVVRDIAAMYSSGVVTSYKINECVKGDFYICEVNSSVSPAHFQKQALSNSSTIKIDGKDFYASYLTGRNVLIQRKKITEYYFDNIRKTGLSAQIHSVKVLPSSNELAKLEVKYSVRWDRKYKQNFISFLERLERDTNASFENHDIVLQWSASTFIKGRVFVRTNDENTRRLIHKQLYDSVFVSIPELNYCEEIKLESSILTFEKTQREIFEIQSEKLKGLNQITISTSCQA